METPVATCTAAVPRKLPALTLQPGDVVELCGLEWELVERIGSMPPPPRESWYVRPLGGGDLVPMVVHPAALLRYTSEVS